MINSNGIFGDVIMDHKTQFRELLKKQRANLTPQIYQTNSSAIQKLLLNFPAFKHAQKIGCYLPFQQEVDTSLIIEEIWKTQKECYLPSIQLDNTLQFSQYEATTLLANNRFDIPEPKFFQKRILVQELELVIIPLVGFDKKCYRLGMGKGFYDRTFEFLQQDVGSAKPLLIGLGFEFQKVSNLSVEAWDVALDYVITEIKVYSRV